MSTTGALIKIHPPPPISSLFSVRLTRQDMSLIFNGDVTLCKAQGVAEALIWVKYTELTRPNSPQMVVDVDIFSPNHLISAPQPFFVFRLVTFFNSPSFQRSWTWTAWDSEKGSFPEFMNVSHFLGLDHFSWAIHSASEKGHRLPKTRGPVSFHDCWREGT